MKKIFVLCLLLLIGCKSKPTDTFTWYKYKLKLNTNVCYTDFKHETKVFGFNSESEGLEEYLEFTFFISDQKFEGMCLSDMNSYSFPIQLNGFTVTVSNVPKYGSYSYCTRYANVLEYASWNFDIPNKQAFLVVVNKNLSNFYRTTFSFSYDLELVKIISNEAKYGIWYGHSEKLYETGEIK